MKCIFVSLFGFVCCCLSLFAGERISAPVDGEIWVYEKISDTEASIVSVPCRTDGVIRIPEEIDGLKVVRISWLWMEWHPSEMIIPKTVTDIRCFQHLDLESFENLERITVDAGNPRYFSRAGALYSKETVLDGDCSRLFFCPAKIQELVIEADTWIIGKEMWGLQGGKGYDVADTLGTVFGAWGGDGLTNLIVRAENPVFCSENGVLYDKEKKSLFHCVRRYRGRVQIPKGVKSVHRLAFIGCSNLSDIEVEEGNTKYSSGNGLLCSQDGKILYAVPGGKKEIILPDSVETVCHVSRSDNLERAVLNASLKEIGGSAFELCTNLVSLTLPSSVTNIGSSAFRSCYRMSELVLTSPVCRYGDSMCEKSGLRSIEIPASMRQIPESAFSWCSQLKRVVMADGVESVSRNAFAYCPSLETVSFGQTVTNIAERAFFSSSLSEDLIVIGAFCPTNCSQFAFELPPHVKTIGDEAFAGTLGPETLNLDGDDLDVGKSAFSHCANIKRLNIGAGVRSLSRCAFSPCPSLAEITVSPENKNYAEVSNFLCDKARTKLVLAPYAYSALVVPTGIAQIGAAAFLGNRTVKSVVFPDTVEAMEDSVLMGAISLTDVRIPNSVREIGYCSFAGTKVLKEVTLSDSLKRIDGAMFYESGLEFVDVPQSVVAIGGGAFANCRQLVGINLPSNLEAIWNSAFSGCVSLDQVTIPSKTSWLADNAFQDCSNLCSVAMMKGVATIGRRAFENCVSLERLLLPSSVVGLGNGAFRNCSRLMQVSFAGNAPLCSASLFDDETCDSWAPYQIFQFTPSDLQVKVKSGSSGWISPLVSGIPEHWPSADDFARKISYDDSIVDPDPALEFRKKARVRFMSGTAAYGTPPHDLYRYIGESFALPMQGSLCKDGATFLGWRDGGTVYLVGASYTVKSGGAILTARWSDDLVEGDGHEPVTVTVDGKQVTAGAGGTFGSILNDPPTRKGWSFEGWYTGPDGTGTRLTPNSTVPATPTTVYPYWVENETPVYRLCDGVGDAADLSVATVYNGYLADGDGVVAGTIQVKAAKAKVNRKTGATTSKLTVTIQPVIGTKVSLKGDFDVDAGAISITSKDGRVLDLELGENGIVGTFGDWEIDGARDVFASKASADKAVADDLLAKWKGSLALVFDGGILTVTVGAKGKAKVSGTLANGTKVSASAQMVVGDEQCSIPVVVAKKGVSLAFCLWLSKDGASADIVGLGEDVVIGRPGALSDDAAFRVDAEALSGLLGDDTFAAYLPDGVSVAQKGTKWVVAGGAKAGKIVLGKDGEVDAAKAGANPSALKLSYRAKDGLFTGSFKAYVLNRGKPKAVSVSVSGVVVDGVGYGLAIMKKFGSVPVTIK